MKAAVTELGDEWRAWVRNNGPANLSDSSRVTWYLSTNTTYESWSDIEVAQHNFSSMGAGAGTFLFREDANVPSAVTIGQQYYVLAVVTSPYDSMSSNNSNATNLNISFCFTIKSVVCSTCKNYCRYFVLLLK